jgi:uncharacterized LabA/DUF88 family protein
MGPGWGALTLGRGGSAGIYLPFDNVAIRAYYYTSVVGDNDRMLSIRESLRALQFEPRVFKKDAGSRRSKGVDVMLTKDMLSHSFLGNVDTVVLAAGDGDYVPLVEEVKRLGKRVYVIFFDGDDSGLNKELRLAADHFVGISDAFVEQWLRHGVT